MRIRYALCFGLIFFVFISNTNAQKKSDKINMDIQNSAKALGNLFHKKKTTGTESANKTNSLAPKNTSSSNKPASQVAVAKNQPIGDVGKMAAGVKYIDADAFLAFNDGAALVLKGSATGLIDAQGNFISPYNKYKLMPQDEVGMNSRLMYLHAGIFQFINDNGGYINSKGKVICTNGDGSLFNLTPEKQMVIAYTGNSHNGTASQVTYVTSDGNKYILSHNLIYYNEGIGVISAPGPLAYGTLEGKKISGALFDEANAFSDGMALVGKKDAYGQVKYGYINTEGRLVIPYQFSIKPGNFSEGYARVTPKDNSSFEYAYINKKGEVVLKQTLNDIKKYGTFHNFSPLGFAFTGSYFLMPDLSIISKADFFQFYGVPAESYVTDDNLRAVEGEKDQKLYFTSLHSIGPVLKQAGMIGFINLASKTVVMPSFYKLGVFDPVSHLAYAEVVIGKDTHGMAVFRKGYVNEKGEFALVMGSGSKW